MKDSLAAKLTVHLRTYGDPRIAGKDPWQAQVYHQTNNYGANFNRLLSPYEIDRARLRPSHHPAWKVERPGGD